MILVLIYFSDRFFFICLILDGRKRWEIRSRPVPDLYLSTGGICVDVSLIACKLGGLVPATTRAPVIGRVNFHASRIVSREELLSDYGLSRHCVPRDLMQLMCDAADARGAQLWVWDISNVHRYTAGESEIASVINTRAQTWVRNGLLVGYDSLSSSSVFHSDNGTEKASKRHKRT